MNVLSKNNQKTKNGFKKESTWCGGWWVMERGARHYFTSVDCFLIFPLENVLICFTGRWWFHLRWLHNKLWYGYNKGKFGTSVHYLLAIFRMLEIKWVVRIIYSNILISWMRKTEAQRRDVTRSGSQNWWELILWASHYSRLGDRRRLPKYDDSPWSPHSS